MYFTFHSLRTNFSVSLRQSKIISVCLACSLILWKYSKNLRRDKHYNLVSWNSHPWRQSRSCSVRILWLLFCHNAPLSSWAAAWSSRRGMRRSDPRQADISRSGSSQETPFRSHGDHSGSGPDRVSADRTGRWGGWWGWCPWLGSCR